MNTDLYIIAQSVILYVVLYLTQSKDLKVLMFYRYLSWDNKTF